MNHNRNDDNIHPGISRDSQVIKNNTGGVNSNMTIISPEEHVKSKSNYKVIPENHVGNDNEINCNDPVQSELLSLVMIESELPAFESTTIMEDNKWENANSGESAKAFQLLRLYKEVEDENFFDDIQSLTNNLDNLTQNQQIELARLLRKYKRLFSYKTIGAGAYEHKIRLKEPKVVVKRSYPVPLSLRAKVAKELNEMLEAGIIERSKSQYCNPLRIVKKKKWRYENLPRCSLY